MHRQKLSALGICILGLLVFGQVLGAQAQTEPSQPTLVVPTAEAPAPTGEPGEAVPAPIPTIGAGAALPTPVMLTGTVVDARVDLVDGGLLVAWNTDRPTTGWVVYGDAPDGLNSRAPAADAPAAPTTAHSIALPAPALDAPLYFAIVVDDMRHDAGGWPFKFNAGDAGGLLALYPTAGSETTAARGGLTNESVAELPGEAPRAAGATNRIGIETGHWPNDAGSASCDQLYYERDNTYAVANLMAGILRSYGYTVDVLPAADSRLNGYTADAFIALHNDYCAPNVSGFKVARRGGTSGWGTNGSGDSSDRLVNAVWERYNRVTRIQKHPGSITANMTGYYALGMIYSSTPGVILEMGFWSGERDMLLNQRGALAAGAAESMLAFLGRLDGDDSRIIGSGQTLGGAIAPNNDRDTYYFNGTQGQQATMRMNKNGSSLDSYLTLYGPNGSEVTRNDDSGGNLNSFINGVTLPQTGRYRLVASSYGGSSGGAYTLALQLAANYTPPAGYSFCVYENQRCNFSGTQDVAYGVNGTFTYRYALSGGVDCNNATFSDPVPGIVKACFIRAASNIFTGNVSSTLRVTVSQVRLDVCASNLPGRVVYATLFRGVVGTNPAKLWRLPPITAPTNETCITFVDMDGEGNTYAGVTYYTVASLTSISDADARARRTSCFTATGGRQLCDAQMR